MQGGVRRHSPIIVNSKSPRWDLKLEHGDTPRRTRPFGAPFLRIPEKEWRQIVVQGIDVTVMSSTFRRTTFSRRLHRGRRTAAGCRSQRNATARRGNWKSSARVGLGHGEMTLPGRAAAHVGGTAATSNNQVVSRPPTALPRARSTTTS